MLKDFIQNALIQGRNAIRKISPIERRKKLKECPYINTRDYRKEINIFFKDLNYSKNNYWQKKHAKNVIISLTSFPRRINLFEYTLFSLINQTIRPDKIILWLSKDEFIKNDKRILKKYKKYFEFNFEINFVEGNYRSYKKLIYSLKQYPHNLIVTADDDIFYPPDWLELLYNYHLTYPDDIIAHRVQNISFTNNYLDNYRDWKGDMHDVSPLNFPTTGGGTLYPPHSLFKDSLNNEIFLKLCPFADDIWFYVMAILNRKNIRRIKNGYQDFFSFDYDLDLRTAKMPHLWNINRDLNDKQLKDVLEYYHIYENFSEFLKEYDSGDSLMKEKL